MTNNFPDTFDLDELLKEKKLSPGMRQYIEIKQQYKECILLVHKGDFWEAYLNDAMTLSNKLNFKLTNFSCGLKEPICQCGFPYGRGTSSIENINNILKLGYKIALCEQLEDPKNPSGKIVKRDVVRIITPGTILDEDLLFDTNNFLACIIKGENIGFSYVDISTGEIFASSFNEELLSEELSRVKPSELIVFDEDIVNVNQNIINNYQIYINNDFDKIKDDILEEYFSSTYLDTLELKEDIKSSLVCLLSYVFYTQKKISKNLNNIELYDVTKNMLLDSFTRDSLELTKRMKTNDKFGSLFHILDNTKTAMGSRRLRQRIEQPFMDKNKIENQLDLVEDLVNDRFLSDDLTKILKKVYDIERLCGKLAFDNINPKEVINLKKSIEELPMLKNIILTSNCEHLKDFINDLDDLGDIFLLIDKSILDNAQITITNGDIIKDSYNTKVAHYRNLLKNNNETLVQIEEEQKNILGINLFKFGQNDIDGYYIEITKRNVKQANIPNDYKKVRELSNSYRYTFPKLKTFELEKIEAESKLSKLEYDLFIDIRNQLSENIARMKKTASILANLDIYLSFSEIAINYNYVRPSLNEDNILEIKNGRHPVIERLSYSSFIGNNTSMKQDKLIHIITGPNMSGKSTYMRQVALITLMAQIGCFVPCESANISICDRIFTRIGASDNLANGESTFMVEMNELSQILNNATNKSLILLDEVGRGTSTFDGISIAKATINYISKTIQCHTLFSTHYAELISLENELTNVENYKVEVKENEDNITFLRNVVKGCSTKSYGIQVAKSANMPKEVIQDAKNILMSLEQNKTTSTNNNSIIEPKTFIKEHKIENNENMLSSQENSIIEKEIKNLDLLHMTPFDAIVYLNKIQMKLKN